MMSVLLFVIFYVQIQQSNEIELEKKRKKSRCQPHPVTSCSSCWSSSLLSCSWFQEVWSVLRLPPVDALPPSYPDASFHEGPLPVEQWPHLLSPLLYIFGAAVAYWGSTLLCLLIRLLSLVLAPLHRSAGSFQPALCNGLLCNISPSILNFVFPSPSDRLSPETVAPCGCRPSSSSSSV